MRFICGLIVTALTVNSVAKAQYEFEYDPNFDYEAAMGPAYDDWQACEALLEFAQDLLPAAQADAASAQYVWDLHFAIEDPWDSITFGPGHTFYDFIPGKNFYTAAEFKNLIVDPLEDAMEAAAQNVVDCQAACDYAWLWWQFCMNCRFGPPPGWVDPNEDPYI